VDAEAAAELRAAWPEAGSARRLKLTTSAVRFDDAALADVASFASLGELCLFGTRGLTDAGLAELSHAVRLTDLQLTSGPGITDAGMTAIGALAGLRSLALRDLRGVSDPGLARLAPLASLRSLTLGSVDFDGSGLGWLAGRELDCLALSSCPGLTDLDGIARLRRLERVELVVWDLSDARLAVLSGVPGLSEARLTGCLLAGSAESLLPAGGLERLYLSAAQRTDAGLRPLVALRRLRELRLSRCPTLRDDHLAPLPAFPALEILRLHACRGLSDLGTGYLGRLKRLRTLDLRQDHDTLPLFSLPALAALRSELEGCRLLA
jgi:hypothetical protein